MRFLTIPGRRLGCSELRPQQSVKVFRDGSSKFMRNLAWIFAAWVLRANYDETSSPLGEPDYVGCCLAGLSIEKGQHNMGEPDAAILEKASSRAKHNFANK